MRLQGRILGQVTSDGRRAIAIIRECVEGDRFSLAIHFSERMQQRGLFWTDVEAVLFEPTSIRAQAIDRYGRPKWLIRGEAATGDEIEIVCAIEVDESETEFITLYWED